MVTFFSVIFSTQSKKKFFKIFSDSSIPLLVCEIHGQLTECISEAS